MLSDIKNFIIKHKYKIIAAISFAAAGYFAYSYLTDQSEIKMSAFIEALEKKQIDEVVVAGGTIYFKSEASDWYWTCLENFPKQSLFQMLKSAGVIYSSKEPSMAGLMISSAGVFAATLLTVKFIKQQFDPSQKMSLDKSPAIYQKGERFENFYGGENIKAKLREIIDFLKNPQKYAKMGARIRRGVLFHGPPGTGKTMIARALATQAGVSFIRAVASQFQQIYVGMGPKRVRELFDAARKCPHGCIIFIDQIDALGNRNNVFRDSHETTCTINQFLSELDGFTQNQKIVVVGATNRIDLVDKAILRSGRFDYKVQINLPNIEQREGILKAILQKKMKNHEVENEIIRQIALNSENWSGADLETLVNESIYKAISGEKDKVNGEDLYNAWEQMMNH